MDDKTRKTLTVTHRQAGLTLGGLTTFFAILHFLNGNYATKADVKELTAQNVEIKAIVKDGFSTQRADLFTHAADETHKHERMMDTLRDELKSEKTDRIRDIGLVENLIHIRQTKTN